MEPPDVAEKSVSSGLALRCKRTKDSFCSKIYCSPTDTHRAVRGTLLADFDKAEPFL